MNNPNLLFPVLICSVCPKDPYLVFLYCKRIEPCINIYISDVITTEILILQANQIRCMITLLSSILCCLEFHWAAFSGLGIMSETIKCRYFAF